jgi:hypothetical protein
MTKTQCSNQKEIKEAVGWMFHTLLLSTPDEQFHAFFHALDKRGNIVQHDGYLTVEDISITDFCELYYASTHDHEVPNAPESVGPTLSA